MKDLTIIAGQHDNFVLIDSETSSNELKVFYVPVSKYNDGFFNDEDIVPITIEYVSQKKEVFVGGWETPIVENQTVTPENSFFDHTEAEITALEVANELISQFQIEVIEHV